MIMLYRNDFTPLYREIDSTSSIKEIDLRGVSKYSIDRLKRLVEEYEYISMPYCGHEYDCCGCVSSYYVELLLDDKQTTAILKRTVNFNY